MIHVVKILETNYSYIIEDGFKAMIVDPGDADPLLNRLEILRLIPECILLTHNHSDHSNGIDEIKRKFPKVKVINNSRDSLLAFNSDNTVTIIHTPGHTQDSCCFYMPKRGVIFTGDTLFTGLCGKTDKKYYFEMFNSLQKLQELPLYTKVLPGHEYLSNSIEFLKTLNRESGFYNSLLKFDYPSLNTTIADEINNNPFMSSDINYFTKIRDLKG